MAKCKRCNREMKNHEESGMGAICRMKADCDGESGANQSARVQPLDVRRRSRRSYLVFTGTRCTVVVTEDGTGRFASCSCLSGIRCEHIDAVAPVDRDIFPEEARAAAGELAQAA